MIEVEKKFVLDASNRDRLIRGAVFLSERVFTDVYYDTKDFVLTSHDQWLRSREGTFGLKLPLHANTERLANQYNEVEDESEIRNVLDLPISNSLTNDLAKHGYVPFCKFTTTRRKYKNHPFIIDVDTVDFQDFTYSLGEIELMVTAKSEIENAVDKIMAFAKAQNLKIIPVRGKVIEYLKRVQPLHYQALVAAGVVKDFA